MFSQHGEQLLSAGGQLCAQAGHPPCLRLSFSGKNTKNIIIEDFYDENSSSYIGYKHRDWVTILRKFGFKCILNKSTQYSKVRNANARYMFFKKEG